MHYPPIIRGRDNNLEINSNYIDLMKEHNVKKNAYMLICMEMLTMKPLKEYMRILTFKLVSSDYLNFKLYKLN